MFDEWLFILVDLLVLYLLIYHKYMSNMATFFLVVILATRFIDSDVIWLKIIDISGILFVLYQVLCVVQVKKGEQ